MDYFTIFTTILFLDRNNNSGFIACFRSFFGSQLNKYSTPLQFVGNSHSFGLTVDWLNKQIYFCGDLRVMAYDMSKENTRQLFTPESQCTDLAVDPYSR